MAGRNPPKHFDWWGFLLLCGIFLGLAFLWNTPWVSPLKLFVVFLHETSHGLAALATGGRIEEIRVFAEEGGRTVTSGGNAFVVTSAGYLGSMFFGVILLIVATRTAQARWLALGLGSGAVAIALLCMPAEGRMFAAGCGLVLAATWPLPRPVAEFVLRVIGVTSCLYAILDIKSDVLDRNHHASDATRLAEMTGIPGVVWGALWITISLVVTFYAAKWAVMVAKPPKVQSRPR
jgi:Peptidase M50B-like